MSNVLEGSDLVFDHYKKIIRKFNKDEKCVGFKNYNKPEVNTKMQLAGNMYRWFPAHFYKAKNTILNYESECKEAITSIFAQNELTVIDIGAGPGTFTLALCDLLYKNKLNGNGLSSQYKVKAYLVEPNELYHLIAKRLLKEFCKEADLSIEICIIQEHYPEEKCLSELKQKLSNNKSDFIIYSMCNLMNWLDKGFFTQVFSLFYDKEYSFLRDLHDHLEPLHSVLLSVETDNFILKSRLKTFYKLVKERTKNEDLYLCNYPKYKNISYINFPESYYGINFPGIYKGKYLSANLIINSVTSKMCQYENLKDSYFKARMALKQEFPCDEIALKLMESSLDKHLKLMSKEISKGYEFLKSPFGYLHPKDSSKSRPKVYGDLSDTISECSFINTVGSKIDEKFSLCSHGNRINNSQNEFVYTYFMYAWLSKYMKESIKKAKNKKLNFYLHLDIKSFYNDINQDKLFEKMMTLLPSKDERITKFVNTLVMRNIPLIKNNNCGIAQGSIISGFLANVYLDDYDKYLERIIHDDIIYSRYVDDMLLFGKNEDELLELERNIEEYLVRKLDLNINEDKRELGELAQFENQSLKDESITIFVNRFRKVLKSFYMLDNNHYQKYVNNKESFVKYYKNCLMGLDLNINEEWLHRKINKRNGLLDKFKKLFTNKYFIVKYPSPKIENTSEWVDSFKRNNPKLCEEIDILKRELLNRIENIYEEYGNLNDEQDSDTIKIVRRKYRFYTFRASILKVPGVHCYIKKMIDNPWLYNILALRNYPELSKDLIEIAESSDNEFTIITAIWALSEVNKYDEILEKILFDESSTPMLKISCSQALVKLKAWDKIDEGKLKKELLLQKNNPILLKNLLLLSSSKLLNNTIEKELKQTIYNFRALERELNLKALEIAKKDMKNIIDKLDMLPDWIEAKNYPDIEPSPNVYPIS